MVWADMLISNGPAVGMADHLWLVGALIIILVAVQCAVAAVDNVLRITHESAQRAREARLLKFRLARARKRRDDEQQHIAAWNGWRKFTVAMRVPESGDVCSFYLKPHDGKPLTPYKPGQYLTFRLDIPGQGKPVIRCYSLSDCIHEDYYRISIRRVGTARRHVPPGLVSCFFHDQVHEGDIVDVKAPSGSFFLDMETTHPVVMLCAGIGVTPMISMLNALVKAGDDSRPVHLFYGVGNRTEHSFRGYLAKLAAQHNNIRYHVCYSRPLDDDSPGSDYHSRGHLNIDVLKRVLPSNNYHYYLCGPPGMMESMINDLKEWGVPEAHIHSEAFGGPTRSAIASTTGNKPPAADANAVGLSIQFARSGRTATWNEGDGTLLEFAEKNQVAIPCGCRAGNCGTCMIAIKKGNVVYPSQPGFEAETGSCLTCCCTPKGDLVLDA